MLVGVEEAAGAEAVFELGEGDFFAGVDGDGLRGVGFEVDEVVGEAGFDGGVFEPGPEGGVLGGDVGGPFALACGFEGESKFRVEEFDFFWTGEGGEVGADGFSADFQFEEEEEVFRAVFFRFFGKVEGGDFLVAEGEDFGGSFSLFDGFAVGEGESPAPVPGGGFAAVAGDVDFDLFFLLVFEGGDEDGGEEFFGHVLSGFPSAEVVDGGPGGAAPDVVELPVDGAHASGHHPSPVFDGVFECHALEDLGEPEDHFAGFGHAEPAQGVVEDEAVAGLAPLVVFHDGVGDVSLIRFGEGGDGFRFVEALEAELAVEAVSAGAVPLEGLFPVPDVPEVGIAGFFVEEFVAVAVGFMRGAGPVGALGVDFGEDVGDEFVPEWGVIVPRAVFPLAVAVEALFEFVVAAPEDDAGVVSQAADVIFGFGGDVGHEVGEEGGVGVAGEHHVVPDADAQFVADVVEPVFQIEGAAPDADHVGVAEGGLFQEVAVIGGAFAILNDVHGDDVGAFGKEGDVVGREFKAAAPFVFVLAEFDDAEADAVAPEVEGLVVLGGEEDVYPVEGLFAEAVGPPEFRVFDPEFERGCGRVEGDHILGHDFAFKNDGDAGFQIVGLSE